jgi:hypothetical protein
LTLYFPISIA